MSPRTLPRHPPDDRLERLLRRGGELPTATQERHGADEGPSDDWDLLEELQEEGVEVDDRARRGRHRAVVVPVLSVPAALRSADLRVGVRAVRGLLVLVVVATLVLGGRWLWTQRMAAAPASAADRVAVGDRAAGADGAGANQNANGSAVGAAGPDSGAAGTSTEDGAGTSPDDGAGTATDVDGSERRAGSEEAAAAGADERAGGAGTAPGGLVIHVAGEVVEPGVVTIPAGSRVVDALRAAGGVTAEADQSTLNLARPLVDGERVWVGRPGETPPVAHGPPPGASGSGSASGGGAAWVGQAAPLDLNAATQADLEELPGVGPVTAGHILAWREEHGRFSSVDELLEVSGIGERTLAQLAPLVTVGG